MAASPYGGGELLGEAVDLGVITGHRCGGFDSTDGALHGRAQGEFLGLGRRDQSVGEELVRRIDQASRLGGIGVTSTRWPPCSTSDASRMAPVRFVRVRL